MKRNLFSKENLSIWIGVLFVAILSIVLLTQNIYMGIVGIIFTIILGLIAWEKYTGKREEFKEYIDNLNIVFDGFTKKAIFDMPFSIAVLDSNNFVSWYNSRFKKLFDSNVSLVDEHIKDLLPDIETLIENNRGDTFFYEYNQKDYEVHTSFLENEKYTLIYFIDITEKIDILNKYENEQMVVMSIRLDNYEELNQEIPSERRPIVYAEIDSIITSYFHKLGAFIKKNENGKYYAITFKESLDEIITDKFSFVEDIRNISTENTISPTLSIGVGYEEISPRENENSANGALDIALGRGGDQIVLKSKEKLEYFGGKNQATEKRTKVRSRVMAHALSQFIEKSTEVFISGHINPDMDSLGSSIGLWYAVKSKNKKAYIILSNVTPAIKNLYEYAIEKIEGLEDCIISPEKAESLAKLSSLYIITDNHRKNSTESPELFEKTANFVVIDHHRRGNDYIENSILSYIEPSSSSASELVTEMLRYMDEKIKISKAVSEALFAGIVMDTKNFTKQTGVRTFEAATSLKESGADSNIINKLFVQNFDWIKYKSEIITSAQLYKDIFAIGVFDRQIQESTLIASQAANELIGINGVEASFVITKIDNKVHISARSNENISVQLIMEKLNGGGHRNMAATQIEVEIEEAKKLLKKAINEYIEEDTE